MISQTQLLQSKLLDSHQVIERLRLQNQYHEQNIQQLHAYIERLERSVTYYQTISRRSQDQIRFLQGEPVRQKVEHSLPKNPFPHTKDVVDRKKKPSSDDRKSSNKFSPTPKSVKTTRSNRKKSIIGDHSQSKVDKSKNVKASSVLDYLKN